MADLKWSLGTMAEVERPSGTMVKACGLTQERAMWRAMLGVVAVVLVAGILGRARAGEEPVAGKGGAEVTAIVAVPERGMWVLNNDQSHLDVILMNSGPKPIQLYDEWNSWGWDNVRLEWEADGKKGTVTHGARGWSKNFVTTTALPPGGALVRAVCLEKEWQGWPALREGMKLTVRAVYESTQEGGGWRGKAESAAVTVEIVDRREK